VAEEQQLPDSWLNDDVKAFLSEEEDKRLAPVAIEGIRIQIPTARYLLALKARAAREPLPGYDGDRSDLAFLIRKMEIRTLEEVQRIIDSFFPDDVIPEDKAKYLEAILKEVWDEV